MTKTSRVSIVIPCYNVGSYVTRCLESIFNQSYDNIEVIAVNDASQDDTYAILTSMRNHASIMGGVKR